MILSLLLSRLEKKASASARNSTVEIAPSPSWSTSFHHCSNGGSPAAFVQNGSPIKLIYTAPLAAAGSPARQKEAAATINLVRRMSFLAIGNSLPPPCRLDVAIARPVFALSAAVLVEIIETRASASRQSRLD